MNLGREDHRRPAVRRFTDDLDIPLFAEQPRQALANDDMIVGKKDPDFPAPPWATGAGSPAALAIVVAGARVTGAAVAAVPRGA